MIRNHVLIILSGAADEPLAALGGKTPLEAAATPALDVIARRGRLGLVRTLPEGLPVSRDVALLGLVGCDVRRSYSGYAGLEALAARVFPRADEVVFRCDLVTVAGDRVTDPRAGGLSDAEARALFDALQAELGGKAFRFVATRGSRGLLLAPAELRDLACTPSHDMLDRPRARHAPAGPGERALRDLMRSADELLADHEINRTRAESGEPPANAIWPWGQGVLPRARRFRDQYALRGAAVGDEPLFRGAALLRGWTLVEPVDPSAAAIAALESHELVAVHCDAPLEAALAGDAAAKLRACEQIDRDIVAPLLEAVRRSPQWSIAVAVDLAAPAERRTFAGEPVPFAIAGSAPIGGTAVDGFGESAARQSDLFIDRAWEMMEYVLRV